MTLLLREIAEGIWYKFGAGVPVEATQDEIALWQSAQAEVTGAVTQAPAPQVVAAEARSGGSDQPKGTWDRVMDLAKWAAFFLAVATGVTLYMDWQFIHGLYGEFGAEEIAFNAFAASPIHYAGIRNLTEVVLFVFMSVSLGFLISSFVSSLFRWVVSIGSRFSNWTAKFPRLNLTPAWKRLGKALPYWEVILLVIAGFLVDVTKEKETLCIEVAIWSSITISFFFAACFSTRKMVKDRDDGRLMMIALFLLVFYFLFYTYLTELPQVAGREEAWKILRGEKASSEYLVSSPGVALVTKNQQFMSDLVEVLEAPDGAWAYCAKEVLYSGMDVPVPSLRYLGADANTMYLLDAGHLVVHAIPRDDVLNLLFFPPGYPGSSQFRNVFQALTTLASPTDKSKSQVDFRVVEQRLVPKQENEAQRHVILIAVVDQVGNPLDGLSVWDPDHPGQEAVTGMVPEPYHAEYVLWGFDTYSLEVLGTTSERTKVLSTNPWFIPVEDLIAAGYCPNAADCKLADLFEDLSFSWYVTFQRTR